MDTAYRVPFTRFRFGLDALLGLLPGVGDVAGALASTYLVVEAARLGAPRAVLIHMVANIAIEALLGTVPLIGDVFDAGWKANVRNVALLRRHLEGSQPSEVPTRSVVVAILGGLGLLIAAILLLVILVARSLVTVVGR